MLTPLVLLTLAPAAPAPKDPPPPVEVTAERYVHPPRLVEVGGQAKQITVDDGNFIRVTIRNTSKEALPFQSRHELGDLVYVRVADEKGKEVSRSGFHLELLCSSRARAIELKPGESATVIAHLLQDWPHDARHTGKYTARVVFASGKVRAESAATFSWEYLR